MSDDRRPLAEQVAALARRITGRPPIPDAEPVDELPTELPPGTGAALASLRAAVPGPITPPVAFTVEPIDDDRTFTPLHVREWTRHVDALVADVKTSAPIDSPFGAVNATSSIRLALLALRTAATQAQPQRDILTGVRAWPVEPDELVHLHALVGEAHDALAELIAAVQQQLVDAYRAAQRGDLHGPPGADPAVEVAAVMTTMLNVSREASSSGRECAVAAERLGRLVRIDTPHQ